MWFFLDILRLVEMTAFCKYLDENEKWRIHRETQPNITLVQFFPFYAVTTSVNDSFYLHICLFSIFYCSLKISYLIKKEKNILKSFTKSDYVNCYWKLGSHVFFFFIWLLFAQINKNSRIKFSETIVEDLTRNWRLFSSVQLLPHRG